MSFPSRALFFLLAITLCTTPALPASGRSDVVSKVMRRVAIEKEARRYAEAGDLDRAIVLFHQAMRPEYIDYDYQVAMAEGSLREIYKWKGEYSKAFEIVNNLDKRHPNIRANMIEKEEIEALMNYSATSNGGVVREHISFIQGEYGAELPPKGYSLRAPSKISDILRLYDTIGDHDAGIAFVDEIVEYLYSKHPEMKRAGSLEEATVKADSKSQTKDPNWRGYRIIREYLLVREAFELDKKEGTKGRATKALIQSDYFPW